MWCDCRLEFVCACACARACVCVFVFECVRACVRVCVRVWMLNSQSCRIETAGYYGWHFLFSFVLF